MKPKKHFEDREVFTEWLAELIDSELDLGTNGDISTSFGAYGRCDIDIYFDNGDKATISIKMQDENFEEK